MPLRSAGVVGFLRSTLAAAVARALLLSAVLGLAALAGCGQSGGGSCPSSAPLDCGNGSCCQVATPYLCSNGIKPACYPYGPADGSACAGYILCGGGGGSGVCAHWSCGGSSQCASVMGAPSGVQCQFAAGQSCAQWCATYVPSNCSCS